MDQRMIPEAVGGVIVCHDCGQPYNCTKDVHICSQGDAGKIAQIWRNAMSHENSSATSARIRELEQRCALAESQAAELREEVERLKGYINLAEKHIFGFKEKAGWGRCPSPDMHPSRVLALLHENKGSFETIQALAQARDNIKAENAILREQMEQIDAENDELLTEINQLYMQLERQQRAVTDEEWKVITDTLDSLTKWSAGGFKNEDGWSPMWNPTLRRLRNLVASRASSPEQARATETEEKE